MRRKVGGAVDKLKWKTKGRLGLPEKRDTLKADDKAKAREEAPKRLLPKFSNLETCPRGPIQVVICERIYY